MHFIVYGPEGSGKGTQAKLLAQKINLPLYTSGDLVRKAAISDKGLIGDARRRALDEGKYVPDSEMYVLWKNKLRTKESKKGFILDGFPRNIHQAQFLIRKITKYGYKIDKVIYLKLTNEEAIKRLSKRKRKLFSGSSINHDDPQRVKQRLAVYREQEKELLVLFKRMHILLEINGAQSKEEVFKDILTGSHLR